MADPRTDHPAVGHHLGAALRFIDAFTVKAVSVPLDVRAETLPAVKRMPNTPWKAVAGPNDGTYRFLVTNRTVMPVGAIAVSVSAPGEEYMNFESVTVMLPTAIIAHPPTPDRSDFLAESATPPWPPHVVPLWPTRVFKLPAGETAVAGAVTSTGGVTPISKLRIKIWPAAAPMPTTPYTYTNDGGEFVVRLPGLKVVNGGVVALIASLALDVRLPPTYATPVIPTSPFVPFSVSFGHVTTLEITVP